MGDNVGLSIEEQHFPNYDAKEISMNTEMLLFDVGV